MNTLVVSNNILESAYSSILVSKWENRPSIEGYYASVLDLYLDAQAKPPFSTVSYKHFPFYTARYEIRHLLKAGGVVICLTHLTYINNSCMYTEDRAQHVVWTLRNNLTYAGKHTGNQETCYDFLEQGFLQATQLDHMNVRANFSFNIIGTSLHIKNYFNYVKAYYKAIRAIISLSSRGTTIEWMYSDNPFSESVHPHSDDVVPLAVNSITNEPIAAEIKYLGLPGSLVILPTYDLDLYRENPNALLWNLKLLAEEFYEQNIKRLGVTITSPDWALKYRVKQSVEAEKRLRELRDEITNFEDERDRYDKILVLLYGYGDELKNTVAKVFGNEWFGFSVKPTEKGASLDLFVHDTNRDWDLAIEVTGIAGKFTKDNEHLSDVLDYLPTNVDNNSQGLRERIVLVVNTFRDDDLDSRDLTDDISQPTQTIANNNSFCIIRSIDLYKLWNDFVDDKRTASEIFEAIFQTQGIFEYKSAS